MRIGVRANAEILFAQHEASARRLDGGAGTGCEGFRGRIVNITSVSVYTASINRGDFCMAKGALAMLTRFFAIRRWGKPEDIGHTVQAIAEDQFLFSTGACYDVEAA